MIKKNKLILITSAIFAIGFFIIFENLSITETRAAVDLNSADAIAVRIIPNPNHYSISRWYESQGFQGSPQALTVDGYEAIRDGRTVYVNAANIDQTAKTIYTNIYLISYNQDSTAKTVDILGQMISHWKFNDNLTETSSPASNCSLSSLTCASNSDCTKDSFCAVAGTASSSCVLKSVKNCRIDSDCPTSFFCNSLKAKVTRDIKRIGRLEELREALYNFKTANTHYPLLAAGTYLVNNSLSVWPSWSQSFLTDLAVSQNLVDPINKLGHCSEEVIKNGSDYIATNRSCNMASSGGVTASCSNAFWEYRFNITKNGSYRFWLDSTNYDTGRGYGELSLFNPKTGAENVCSDAGVQHHLNIYLDGVLKGSVCNPAVNPDKLRQTGFADLGVMSLGDHLIKVEWDNDWTYNPDGVWGTADDADSNIKIYQIGVIANDNFDPKTCWNQNTQKFVHDPVASSLILPAGSYALAYSTDGNGSRYSLCATLESSSSLLGYHFYPQDLTSSACISDTGVVAGGLAGNTAPQLITKSLVGEVNQPFNGFIKVVDAEGNPLTWRLDTSGTNWSGWKNSQPPVLQDTTNPNQKKVFSGLATVSGNYNATLIVDDGQGGILSTITTITIASSTATIEADDEEYVLDPILPLNYNISFTIQNLLNNGSALVAGPFDVLFDPTNTPHVITSSTPLGNGRYQVNYKGNISTAHKFYSDTSFKYRFAVTDISSKTFTKDFTIKVKIENPQLDFNCSNSARIGQDYSCIIGQLKQENHTISYAYVSSGLPADLSFSSSSDYRITGTPSATTTSQTVAVKATNEYGASSTKSLLLKVNNYCGDGLKQTPNTEGRGGLYNDGREDCDGLAGVVTTSAGVPAAVASSKASLQYSCSTGVGSTTPNPIVANDQCVFKSPLAGGGYCGDGYCQSKINGQPMENKINCFGDCSHSCEPIIGGCADKCDGIDNGCGQSCPITGTHNFCAPGETKVCSSVKGNERYLGTAICNSDCTGFDTSACTCPTQCTGKCAGEADGCGGKCPSTGSTPGANDYCVKAQTKNCDVIYNAINWSGTATCNNSCSGYTVNVSCVCHRDWPPSCVGGDNFPKCAGAPSDCSGQVCKPEAYEDWTGWTKSTALTFVHIDKRNDVCPYINAYTASTTTCPLATMPAYCSSSLGVKTCNSNCSGYGECVGPPIAVETNSSSACATTNPQMNGYSCCELTSCERDGCSCCGRPEGASVPSGYNLVGTLSPCGNSTGSCKLSQSKTNSRNWIITTNHTTANFRCWR